MKPVPDKFSFTIVNLWERLGLPEPRFTEPGRVQLRVDGLTLDLVDNHKGMLVVEGLAGPLSEDSCRRMEQTRAILNTNFGLLLDFDVGIYLVRQLNGATAVAVRATHPFASGDLDWLIKQIEDVVQTIEYYRPELASTVVTHDRRVAATAASSEPAVIFRP